MAHPTGSHDVAQDLAESPEHPPLPNGGGEGIRRLDTVLEGNEHSLGAKKGAQGGAHGLYLPCLHAHQDNVDRADGRDVLGRIHRPDVEIPGHALDAEPILFNASRWAPLARKLTRSPAWARRPPK